MDDFRDQEELTMENEAKERTKKKSRFRMLGTKSKKFKRLIKRFSDDEQDEEAETDKKVVKKATVQKKIKKSQNQFNILQNENNEDIDQDEENSPEIDEADSKQKVKPTKEKPKVFIKDVFSQILQEKTEKRFEQNPMFSNYQKPFKKIKKELNKEKSARIKKRIKLLKQYIGYKKPQFDDKVKEKELKISVTKGISKILNTIKQFSDEKL